LVAHAQTNLVPSLLSGSGPGLSQTIACLFGSMRKKRFVTSDISANSPAGVSIH
jgi:hypothetical protein